MYVIYTRFTRLMIYKEETHCCGDNGGVQSHRGGARRRPVAHVFSARAIGYVDVVRPEPAVTILVIVHGIRLITAVSNNTNTPVDCE